MMKNGKKVLLSFSLCFILLSSFGLVLSTQLFIPKGSRLYISNNTTLHFGKLYTNTSGSAVHLTSFNTNGWINYTVDSSSTQNIHTGNSPTIVVIDGTNRTIGNGWSFSSGTITITASSSASIGFFNATSPTTIRPRANGTYNQLVVTDTTAYHAENDQNDSTFVSTNDPTPSAGYDTFPCDTFTLPSGNKIDKIRVWIRHQDLSSGVYHAFSRTEVLISGTLMQVSARALSKRL